jgi:hypothetical protein
MFKLGASDPDRVQAFSYDEEAEDFTTDAVHLDLWGVKARVRAGVAEEMPELVEYPKVEMDGIRREVFRLFVPWPDEPASIARTRSRSIRSSTNPRTLSRSARRTWSALALRRRCRSWSSTQRSRWTASVVKSSASSS